MTESSDVALCVFVLDAGVMLGNWNWGFSDFIFSVSLTSTSCCAADAGVFNDLDLNFI
jgi:hypothetical protein